MEDWACPADDHDAMAATDSKHNTFELLAIVALQDLGGSEMADEHADGIGHLDGLLALQRTERTELAEVVNDVQYPLILAVGLVSHIHQVDL